jgi:hypothetical protein
MMAEPLFVAVGRLLDGKPSDDVVPILITIAARALVQEADGNIDKLSTLLLRFCRLLENEAADMLEGDRQ